MITFFIASLVSLFSLINPLGAIPVFLSLTNGHDQEWIQRQVFKTSLNILVICLISYFIGTYILSFFGISIDALKITGGIIIARSGFLLLNSKHKKDVGKKLRAESELKEDISFVPLAMPLLSGPGSISFLINASINNKVGFAVDFAMILAIIVISVAIYFILRFSPKILKVIGQAGINAMGKIMGFLVFAIGVELVLGVILQFSMKWNS